MSRDKQILECFGVIYVIGVGCCCDWSERGGTGGLWQAGLRGTGAHRCMLSSDDKDARTKSARAAEKYDRKTLENSPVDYPTWILKCAVLASFVLVIQWSEVKW